MSRRKVESCELGVESWEMQVQGKNKGGNTMSTLARKLAGVIAVGMLAVGMVWMSAGKAQAYSDALSTNNVAGLTVRITPNVDRGIQISSAPGGFLQLGSVDLGVSTFTVNPATITIMGNVSTTELDLGATIFATVGNASWNFDNSSTTAADLLATWAVFSGIGISSRPSQNEFTVSNATVTTTMVGSGNEARIGGTSGNGTRFEGPWTGSDMDSMPISTQRHLWIQVKTPASTSITGEQNINFNLNVTDVTY